MIRCCIGYCRSFPVRDDNRDWLQAMLFSKFWNQVEEGEGAIGKPDYEAADGLLETE